MGLLDRVEALEGRVRARFARPRRDPSNDDLREWAVIVREQIERGERPEHELDEWRDHLAWIDCLPKHRGREDLLRRLALGEYAHLDAEGWCDLIADLDAMPIYGP